MFVKPKNIVVIVLSSVIVASVFMTTIVGYSFYTQWKKDSFTAMYKSSIYRLTGEMFKNEVTISNINVYVDSSRTKRSAPIVEGSIKNNTGKTISSIMIEVSFSNNKGVVVYNDWFYVLNNVEREILSPAGIGNNVVFSGGVVSFKEILKNCPKSVVEKIREKTVFAKSDSEEAIVVSCKATGMSVI